MAGSVRLPSDAFRILKTLGETRAEGADRWYGLWLRVTDPWKCETVFDDNPDCANDEAFFDV